jgi:hypothetical protein
MAIHDSQLKHNNMEGENDCITLLRRESQVCKHMFSRKIKA